MSRKPIIKELNNASLASGYGGWTYCNGCNKTIAYLCYSTYDYFKFHFNCKCGESGSVQIEFQHASDITTSSETLATVKNRLCCPNDSSPLFSVIEKNLDSYSYFVTCNSCQTQFSKDKVL